jgi:hypothetical protein
MRKMTKTCRSCQIRTIATGTVKGEDAAYVDRATAKSVELCNLCHVEADYENTHSDDDHDSEPVDGCWVCYPELNQRTQADERGARKASGTSRSGMVFTVPVKASGKEKAEAVKAQITADVKVTVRTVKGVTTLRAGALRLAWDAQGRFDYDASRYGDRKVRNAAAAIRTLNS